MAVPKFITLYVLNDQYLEVDGLADAVSGVFDPNATFTANLYDLTGAVVPTFTGPVTLNYVAASNGIYRGVVTNTFNPPIGGGYTMKLDAVDGTTKLHIEIPVVVLVRTS